MLTLYNTRTKTKEPFHPLSGNTVKMYTCGPTVYNYVHIGNLRTFIFEDILRRTLQYNGYKVEHIMNITDVGHLTDDADQGEDKMEKGARTEGKSAWNIAAFYTQAFKENIGDLNILEPTKWVKATDHIEEQIEQVQKLLDKGYAYETNDGIYFDTTKLDDYGKLAGLDKQDLQAGARVEMGEKKNKHDFALWKFTQPGVSRQMEWEAFGKKGFPGWHIECSAMSMKYLGDQFDIHCGGVDLIPVHHTNEIAQAEAITGKKPWVQTWMHGEFLLINNSKMSKSEGNFITLKTIKKRGFSPLGYRYFVLQAHYRKQLNFTWEALEAAEQGLKKLRRNIAQIPDDAPEDQSVAVAFQHAINDDLNMPEALAVIWKALHENRLTREMIISFDKVLGLNLHNPAQEETLPEEIQKLATQREQAREEKNWDKSDVLRDEITSQGYIVEDTEAGQRIYPSLS